jgi:uncharacterized membrane protein
MSNLRPNMRYNMIIFLFFLHQALHYNQIYNFTLNDDYKFKTIIVWKDIRVLKSIYIYFWILWTHGSLCVEYIKAHKNSEMI